MTSNSYLYNTGLRSPIFKTVQPKKKITTQLWMKFLQTLFISVFSEQPNVVFVMLDDLGWGDVSWNNLKIKSTPFLESLARNGTILDQSYTTHRCSPRHWLKIIKNSFLQLFKHSIQHCRRVSTRTNGRKIIFLKYFIVDATKLSSLLF